MFSRKQILVLFSSFILSLACEAQNSLCAGFFIRFLSPGMAGEVELRDLKDFEHGAYAGFLELPPMISVGSPIDLPYEVIRRVAHVPDWSKIMQSTIVGEMLLVADRPPAKPLSGEIRLIVTRSEYENGGVGRALLQDAISVARERGLSNLRIIVPKWGPHARDSHVYRSARALCHLLERAGFQKVKEVDDDSTIPTHEARVDVTRYSPEEAVLLKLYQIGSPVRRFEGSGIVYELALTP